MSNLRYSLQYTPETGPTSCLSRFLEFGLSLVLHTALSAWSSRTERNFGTPTLLASFSHMFAHAQNTIT